MRKIMVVDDEVVIATRLEERLTSMGHEVVGTAFSGEEALEMARHLRPDLILMDIVMPGKLDGIDVSRIIKAELDIPVIFLTAHGGEKLVERAKDVEPFGYIIKPFEETEIKAAIEVALYKKDMEWWVREWQEKYRTLTESSLTGIFIHQDGKYVFVNDRFAEMHGYTSQELFGRDYWTLIHPDEREARR
jgi:CheY-like chemotaxis protein